MERLSRLQPAAPLKVDGATCLVPTAIRRVDEHGHIRTDVRLGLTCDVYASRYTAGDWLASMSPRDDQRRQSGAQCNAQQHSKGGGTTHCRNPTSRDLQESIEQARRRIW